MNTKEKVEHYIKHDRSLTGGKHLYNQLPGKSLAISQNFGRFTNNDANIEKICYELCKLAEIPERNFRILMQSAVEPIEKIEKREEKRDATEQPAEVNNDELLLAFDADTADYIEAKKLASALDLKPKSQKKVDVFKALAEAKSALVTTMLQELPQEIKASIRLRDQFPFLREKNCPPELHLLVADLISCYERFKENQPKLHDAMTNAERKVLVKTVKDDYISNKQAYDELEHYKLNKAILGKHPLFERLAEKEAIRLLKTEALTKEIHNLTTNRNRNKTKGNVELTEKYDDLLAFANEELGKR